MSKLITAVLAAVFAAVTLTPVAFAADKADEKKAAEKKKGDEKKKGEGKKKAEEKK